MPNEYTTPTKTTTPVADTTAGLWTFGTAASHLLLTNTSGQRIYVRFNTSTAASVAAHDLSLADGASINIAKDDYGLDVIKLVGVWFPAAATVGNFTIRGT